MNVLKTVFQAAAFAPILFTEGVGRAYSAAVKEPSIPGFVAKFYSSIIPETVRASEIFYDGIASLSKKDAPVLKPETFVPQIGDLDDGGVYVGKSATTGKDLHAALADEPEYLTYGDAFAAAAKMRKQLGRENAHIPTPEELNVNLYQNKDKGKLSGTFNTSGSYPASHYRSSAPYGSIMARVQWFVDEFQNEFFEDTRQPVRLVW